MTELAERSRKALEPLRAALLEQARSDADAAEAAAAAHGEQLLESARRQRVALLDEARARGEADAVVMLRTERARAQREARGLVLGAQRAAYDDLRKDASVAVRALLEDPSERARMSAAVRAQLGEKAVVRDHPDGGLVGEAPDGRMVDASVATLVDAALASIDLQSLWAAE